MVWVKIDDQFAENPKVVQVGPLGMAMQVAALCYCNLHLTDGFIPRGKVPRLIDLTGQSMTWEQVVGILTAGESPLWEEVDGGYLIHDYLDFQPSRAEVEKERQAARDRMAALRDGRKKNKSSQEVRPNIAGSSLSPVPDTRTNEDSTTPPPPPEGERVNTVRPSRRGREIHPMAGEVLAYYRRLFFVRFGKEPFVDMKGDAQSASQLLDEYPPHRLWNMLQAYFADEDCYIKGSAHTFALFKAQLNKYILSEDSFDSYRNHMIRAPSTPEAIRAVLEAVPEDGGDIGCLTN